MPSYALYSIPLYVCVALLPHVYSVVLLAGANTRYNNVSPRSAAFASSLQNSKKIPPDCLRKYERCRAAHNNMMENMAYFVGAAIVGSAFRVDTAFMNNSIALYFLTRIAYLASYVQNENPQLSFLRSLLYTAGMLVLTLIYIKAGNVLISETT